MSNYLLLNDVDVSDLVKSLRIGYEVLQSDSAGRNANGDMVIDIVARKVKIYVTFRAMDNTEMTRVLEAIRNYVFRVEYLDPKTNTNVTVQCYPGTPEPEYYCILDNRVLYKEMSLNFIQI